MLKHELSHHRQARVCPKGAVVRGKITMSVHSAGILVYRYHNNDLQVLLVHPGGPFWSRKDLGAWSIPKGIFDESENPLDAAKREFREETGFVVEGEFIELGKLRQPSKKIVHAWSIEDDFDLSLLKSNKFKLEWPRKSGNIQEYPEVDKGEWFSLDIAQKKIFKGQREFLARLVNRVQFSRNQPSQ